MARLIDADCMKEELLWGNVFLPAIQTNTLVDLIDNQPTIDPESLRPHGEWVVLTIDNYFDCAIFGCSQCKTAIGISRPTWKFCPCCGAKMEMEKE